MQQRPSWQRYCPLAPVLALVVLWYSSSISIIFTNKSLLSGQKFAFPFFMTACNNGMVAFVAWALTRLPRFRQPALPRSTICRVVLPIGICTALDIGFSNWSLVFISVRVRVRVVFISVRVRVRIRVRVSKEG